MHRSMGFFIQNRPDRHASGSPSGRAGAQAPERATITIRMNGLSVKRKRAGREILSGIFARKTMPDAKRGLTISISWDIKKESVLRRETVCPPKGRRERLPRSAQREDAKLKQKETTIMDTFEKIRALLAEQLDIDPAKITMDSDIMGDFEADSLDIVDMVMTLEDEFGIEVPDDAIENMRTVGDVVKFVDSHKG